MRLTRVSSVPAAPSPSPGRPPHPEGFLPPSALYPTPSYPGQILSPGTAATLLNEYNNGARDHLPVHGGPPPLVNPLDGEMLRVYSDAL